MQLIVMPYKEKVCIIKVNGSEKVTPAFMC